MEISINVDLYRNEVCVDLVQGNICLALDICYDDISDLFDRLSNDTVGAYFKNANIIRRAGKVHIIFTNAYEIILSEEYYRDLLIRIREELKDIYTENTKLF